MSFPPDPANIDRKIHHLRNVISLWAIFILAALTLEVYLRQPAGDPPIAATRLDAGKRLHPGDLATKSILALNGRFLDGTVQAGKPVTPSMTSATALPHTPRNALAVLVTVASASPDHAEFDPTDRVEIMHGTDTLATGTVLDRGCSGTDCTYLVEPDPTAKIERSALDGVILRRGPSLSPASSGIGD